MMGLLFPLKRDCWQYAKEAQPSVIKLGGDDPVMVESMLSVLYTRMVAAGYGSFMFHAKVYAIGERYTISAVRRAAAHNT